MTRLPVLVPAIQDRIGETAALVIEDQAIIAWMAESLLEDMGFASVEVSANAAAALAAARARTFGLIVSDINLGSDVDGIDVSAEIVATSGARVVFISGHVSAEAQARIAQIHGEPQVLRKPIDGAALAEAVVRTMSS